MHDTGFTLFVTGDAEAGVSTFDREQLVDRKYILYSLFLTCIVHLVGVYNYY